MHAGFIGLGVMGTPMALNLARQFPVTVWNRSASKYPALIKGGAVIAETPAKALSESDTIFTMLFDESAIRSMLSPEFKKALPGKTIVNTSSVSVEFSKYFADQVHQAGGHFIEMPVSGSKVPAEQGKLVAMMAGDSAVADRIRPLVAAMASTAVYCGPVGYGLKTKYAINLYLIAITAGLAEATNLAMAQGLNLGAFAQVLGAGPLASAYSDLKMDKIMREDWSAQAAIKDCYNSTQLIQSAANVVGAKVPIANLCGALYRQAKESGLEEEDMIAVIKVLGEGSKSAGPLHKSSE
ncbi:hypothetical protein G7Z17_g2164 [Cylindrodendrum hubeiense]|uniref:3-hydroxyisobutyrate dehydrogenase n=1 Tax=Cylindrodendrum hubeiense TaxID=595255 RepID=A0A9P5LLA8_9HYPO|nr:hypothetical protein G7Z17_g2164 [Cylindrodendrum hubeiense]